MKLDSVIFSVRVASFRSHEYARCRSSLTLIIDVPDLCLKHRRLAGGDFTELSERGFEVVNDLVSENVGDRDDFS